MVKRGEGMKNNILFTIGFIFFVVISNSNANVAETEREILAPARLMSAYNDLLYADFSQDHNQAIILAGDPAKQGLKLGKKIVGDTVKKVKKVGKAVGQTVKGIGRKKDKEEDEPAKGSGSGHNPNNRMYEGQDNKRFH